MIKKSITIFKKVFINPNIGVFKLTKYVKYTRKETKKRVYVAIFLTIVCTLFTSSGTFLWKLGSGNVTSIESFLFNPYIIFGFILYGTGSIFLIFALSKADLSILYPIISTGFIWTFLISYFVLKEQIYLSKIFGVLFIILGIIVLGFGASKS
jgi:multidrug transporter EmrE-like cation transporter